MLCYLKLFRPIFKKKIADQNKEIYKLTEENAQLKEELGKIGNQRQQNNCPSNLADAFENGVSINKDDSDEEEWDSCRESVGNKIVQVLFTFFVVF